MRSTYQNLRLVKAAAFAEYLANTQLWRSIGNAAFAELIRQHATEPLLPKPPTISPFRKDFVLFHSWFPGMYEISSTEAEAIGQVMANVDAANGRGNEPNLLAHLQEHGWCLDVPIDFDALVSQAIEVFAAIQNPRELREFFTLLHGLRPEVVVEIGTARGGVLYGLSQLASAKALLVSIDLPGGRNCGGQTETERQLFASFGPRTQEFHFIPGNSMALTTKRTLQELLGGRKVDVLFIDGDHSYGAVRSDFEMYRELVSDRGMIALHDICMIPEEWGPGGEVGVFWTELTRKYQTRAIIDPNGVCRPKRPSGTEWSWGIGIVEKPHD
jgi:predicted O-methyltransferase YrrM